MKAKAFLVIIILMFFTPFMSKAQRFGFVDTQAILEKMPEYQNAQKEIEAISKKWQAELDKLYKKVEDLYREYREKEVILSDKQKKEFQDRIIKAEEDARKYQKEKFGYNGELFKLREEKMKPVQEKLSKAIESFAKSKRINVIFDKSGPAVMLYADPAYDYTNAIKKQLGITN